MRGHDAAKVKEAMFASLEGMARDNAKMIGGKRRLACHAHPGRVGLLVRGIYDVPVAQRCPMWTATEVDGVCPCLLQPHGPDHGDPEGAPWQPL